MFSHIKELFTRPSGYSIAKSVRLRSSASAYFNRTPASAGSSQKITYSAWVKRGALSAVQYLMASNQAGTADDNIRFESGDALSVNFNNGTNVYNIISTPVYRDPSAWYHVIVAIDTTQAAAANRVLIYVNGAQITSFGTASYPPQNYNMTGLNTTKAQNIGRYGAGSNYFDGYLTEINFIDGQALTPSSFGSTNALTGVWQPAKYTGTYGTNGFYLNFSDNSSNTATTIGKDYSGNGNNWTPNNISVTAGSTYDSMTDVPTLTSATAANYAVLNPVAAGDYFVSGQTAFALTNGNLNYGSTGRNTFGSVAVSSGKWYWEMVNTSNTTAATALFGLVTVASRTAVYGCYYNAVNGNKGLGTLNSGATETAYGASWTDNDVIGVAVDMDAGTPTVTFYKNNTSQGAISVSSFAGQSVMMWIQNGGNTNNMSGYVNFGQRPFSYTPPTGYVALNTYNLPTSTITNGAAYMAATLYTGNGGTLSVSNAVNGISFQPDLVWIKNRSTAGTDNVLVDSVRGTNGTTYYRLFSDLTNGDSANNSNSVSALNSNGFTVIGTSPYAEVNENAKALVGWQWKAGGTSSSNTNGSITSTVSVGATQGFSVVTYTGNGSAGATFGHGLGVAPSFVIVKERSNANGWLCYHISTGNTGYLELDATLAFQTLSTVWNNTTPSSSVVTLGTVSNVNRNGGTFVAYCFAAVKGFSAFGSYTGNGSTDGPFVYCGFRPRFFMIKRTDTTTNWIMYDTTRMSYNSTNPGPIYANLSSAEETNTTLTAFDILSNGFKPRNTSSWAESNASGGTYIYMAFAENSFKNALAR